MISAELYVADKLKNRTIVELEREKTRLKNKIEELTILQQNDSGSIMIHPSPETKKNMYIEYINEIDKKIEWKKLLTDVKVVKIMLNNYIYLITPDLIRYQKIQENNITDIQKEDISSSDFNFFVNTALERLYTWNEEYIDEEKADIISWEIDLTLKNGDIKKFIGKGQYPYNWSDFYNDFFLFVERSDVQSYDVAIIKAAIYYTLATQTEDLWRIIDCKNLIRSTDFQQKIEQLPVKHPCRINFNYTKTLSNNLYKKAIIETTQILDTFIETNFEESCQIISSIDSETDIDNVVNKIMENYKKIEKAFTKRNSINEEDRKLENANLDSIFEKVNQGDSEAINELAYRYFYGEGIEKNQEKAFELWTDASLRGNIKATYNAALCFLYGEGTYKDEKQAFNMLNKLANEKNHTKSTIYLGEIYHFGLGVDVDYEKAMFYYKKALKKEPHNLRAKFYIAYAYYAGEGVEKNYEKAYKMFYDLVHKDNFEEATFYLGECYYLGRYVQQDYQKAFQYFNKATECEKNYASNIYNSKFYLGEMYLLGRGVNFDCEKAKEYFEDILDERDDEVYYKLALIYSGKYGTYKDEKKAKEYLEKIEIDLCITLMYYLLALRPKEEQNLNKMFELLNSEMDLVQYMLKQIPYKHPAREYHRRLAYLRKEEYDDIVHRLKAKIDRCRTDNKFLEVPKTFVSDEDVIFYATCIVKSYEYPSIDAYIKELLQKKDDEALIFVGKLFINGDLVEKNIKKGLEYLLISKKQNPEISKENRDSCIAYIETTTNDPEIQLLIGKRYLKMPYYKKQGIELIQKAASQGCLEATEIITNVLQEMSKESKLKHPED